MPNLVLTVSLTENGVSLPNFPLIRRVNAATSIPLDTVAQAADNNSTSFHAITGLTSLTSDLQCLVLTTDQLINLKFNASSFLPLSAGGVFLVFGTDITGTIATLATINNPAAAVASNISGVLAGT